MGGKIKKVYTRRNQKRGSSSSLPPVIPPPPPPSPPPSPPPPAEAPTKLVSIQFQIECRKVRNVACHQVPENTTVGHLHNLPEVRRHLVTFLQDNGSGITLDSIDAYLPPVCMPEPAGDDFPAAVWAHLPGARIAFPQPFHITDDRIDRATLNHEPAHMHAAPDQTPPPHTTTRFTVQSLTQRVQDLETNYEDMKVVLDEEFVAVERDLEALKAEVAFLRRQFTKDQGANEDHLEVRPAAGEDAVDELAQRIQVLEKAYPELHTETHYKIVQLAERVESVKAEVRSFPKGKTKLVVVDHEEDQVAVAASTALIDMVTEPLITSNINANGGAELIPGAPPASAMPGTPRPSNIP